MIASTSYLDGLAVALAGMIDGVSEERAKVIIRTTLLRQFGGDAVTVAEKPAPLAMARHGVCIMRRGYMEAFHRLLAEYLVKIGQPDATIEPDEVLQIRRELQRTGG